MSDWIAGLRQIRRNAALAATCVLVLGIGIGSTTAVLTILYDIVLKPLPYRNPDQIVVVHNEFPRSSVTRTGVSAPDFVDLSAHPNIFRDTAAYFFNDFTMTGTLYARHVDAVNATASMFPLLGIRPALGRTFTSDEARAGAGVVVLSDALWRGTFGGDARVIGRTIALDGRPYEIIGVMPAEFQFPYPATQMWVPLSLSPARLAPRERGRQWLQMIARLAPRTTPDRANAALAEIGHALATAYPDVYRESTGWRFSCQRLGEQQTAALRGWLGLACGGVLCVLLIACINAAGLLLVRMTARQGEWAVRAALGATPLRLFRQVVTETALLGFGAYLTGLAFAAVVLRLINTFGPLRPVAFGSWSYFFAVTVAMGSTLLVGILPTTVFRRLSLDAFLKAGSGRLSSRPTRFRDLLVAGQIAVAVALLFTATALTRSVINLLNVPLGFSADRVWTGAIQLPDRTPASDPTSSRFFQSLSRRISALPGVEAASAGDHVPFNLSGVQVTHLRLPGAVTEDVRPVAAINTVLPGYFATLRIPLLSGRFFSKQDQPDTQPVAIVDRAFARQYFQGKDPIGQLVATASDEPPLSIVGVVGSVAIGDLAEPDRPQLYVSALQRGQSETYLVVREARGQDVTAAVRQQLRAMAPNVALFDVSRLQDRVSHSLRVRRFVALVLGAFAGLGVLLAAFGLYGTLAYAVELRRREIAIRLAVGASSGSIRRLFAGRGLRIACAGLAPGLLAAIAVASMGESFLFGVSPLDAWTMVATLAGFGLLALVATWAPAARAARSDILPVLRAE